MLNLLHAMTSDIEQAFPTLATRPNSTLGTVLGNTDAGEEDTMMDRDMKATRGGRCIFSFYFSFFGIVSSILPRMTFGTWSHLHGGCKLDEHSTKDRSPYALYSLKLHAFLLLCVKSISTCCPTVAPPIFLLHRGVQAANLALLACISSR